MLDDNRDFKITTLRMPEIVSRPTENPLPGGDDYENCGIAIQCYFLTSFGRYAFWRIASLQAPEILDELLASFEKIKTPLPSEPPQGKRSPISQPTLVKPAMLSIDHAFPHSEISVAAKTVQIISLLVKKIRGPST